MYNTRFRILNLWQNAHITFPTLILNNFLFKICYNILMHYCLPFLNLMMAFYMANHIWPLKGFQASDHPHSPAPRWISQSHCRNSPGKSQLKVNVWPLMCKQRLIRGRQYASCAWPRSTDDLAVDHARASSWHGRHELDLGELGYPQTSQLLSWIMYIIVTYTFWLAIYLIFCLS